jgi:hypothetical protein
MPPRSASHGRSRKSKNFEGLPKCADNGRSGLAQRVIERGAARPAGGSQARVTFEVIGRAERSWHRAAMASRIPDSIDWPFAAGEGPFHVKGVTYRGHQKYVEEHVPGGEAGILEQLDPALREFWAQPFLASCWYDLAPLVVVAPVCAAACGLSTDDFVHRRARSQVDHDASGVYAYVIKLVSARMIATRLPRLISQYFDFITIETRTVDDERVITHHGGVPRVFAPWLIAVSTGYLERVLEIAGAPEFTISTGPQVSQGEVHGIETVELDLEVAFHQR